jgi:hypothetical protein
MLVRIAARSPGRSMAGPEVMWIGHAHLVGDDGRNRGLAQAWRTEQQHMV